MAKTHICQDEDPTLYDVLAAFFALRGYVEFRYTALPECKKAMTPSKAKAQQFTIMPENPWEWTTVKGYLNDAPRMTKDGNFVITLRNMMRKVKGDEVNAETGEVIEESYFADKSNMQEDGTKKIGFNAGEYQYRTIRLDVRNDGYGIDLSSILVNMGGKKRLFPNAHPNIRPEMLARIFNAVEIQQIGNNPQDNVPY